MNPILIEFYFYKTIPIFPTYVWNYEKYQKIYNIDSFAINFEDTVFNIFRRPHFKFYKEEKNADFFSSSLMELNGDKVAFHAEFDNVLFFYLYGSIKTNLSNFYEVLEEQFKEFASGNGYKIPAEFYNQKYFYLKQIPSIFEVFKFFLETRTNTIERNNDDILINTHRMKSFENEYQKYNFA